MTRVLEPLAGTPATSPSRPARVDDSPERRRSTSGWRASDVLALCGAAASSLGLTAVLFLWLAPFDGRLGALVISWVAFVGSYVLLVSFDEDGPAVRDRLAMVVVHSVAFVILLALVMVIGFTAFRGREALTHLAFFTSDMGNTGPLEPLSSGGMLHALVGTLIMITIALVVTVPLGLTCALFLSEVPGPFARFVRTISEAMTALPSIVAGLFIYATFVLAFGKSGLAAALALSVMMLPIVIRAADVVLRLVPGNLKEASLALGASQWRTVWHVTLPTARSGLATAVILGTARGIGETSPVLLTAGFTAGMNTNPLEGPMVSLPLAVFEFVKSPQPAMIARGFGTAVTLLGLVLLLFVGARAIGGRGAGNLSARQLRRRTRQSATDLERFTARGPREVAPAAAVVARAAVVPRSLPVQTAPLESMPPRSVVDPLSTRPAFDPLSAPLDQIDLTDPRESSP